MSSGFTFYDYFDADGDGTNVISGWLNGDGKDAKAHFATLIPLLEASSPPRFRDSFWKYPYIKPMKDEWAGFIELRKEVKNIQYRLLGQMQDRSIFLVTHGIHKKPNYTTDVPPQTALNRVNQMKNNPAKYRREHDYS